MNISGSQVLFVMLICFLLFGDISYISYNMKILLKKFNSFANHNNIN